MKVVFCLEHIRINEFLLLPGVKELLADFERNQISWAYWCVKDGHLFAEVERYEAKETDFDSKRGRKDTSGLPEKGISREEAHRLMRKRASDTLAVTDSLSMAGQLQAAHVCSIGYQDCAESVLFPGLDLVLLSFEGLDTAFFTVLHHRFLGIPVVIAQTERILLRESCEEDFPAIYRISRETGNDTYTETMGADEAEEKEKFLAYIHQVYGFFGFGLWTLVKREENEIIGRCGISLLDGDLVNGEGFMRPHIELGYLISQKYRRQGYASEACGQILSYAFEMLELPEVYAVIHRENVPSKRLAQKLGFHSYKLSGRDKNEELWRLERTRYEQMHEPGRAKEGEPYRLETVRFDSEG